MCSSELNKRLKGRSRQMLKLMKRKAGNKSLKKIIKYVKYKIFIFGQLVRKWKLNRRNFLSLHVMYAENEICMYVYFTRSFFINIFIHNSKFVPNDCILQARVTIPNVSHSCVSLIFILKKEYLWMEAAETIVWIHIYMNRWKRGVKDFET